MLYTLLIYQAEDVADGHSKEELDAALAGHRELQERAKENGTFVAANELVRSHAATTVRKRSGKITLIDGPFAETKEQLVGLYILDCKNLDEAMGYAERIPHVETGSIEIRPIAHFEDRSGS